jgi:hypothetical protein
MNALHTGPKSWTCLRDEHHATSADMNLLRDMGLIEQTYHGAWDLTAEGRDSMVTTDPQPFRIWRDRVTGRQVHHNDMGWFFEQSPQEEDADGEAVRLEPERVQRTTIMVPPNAWE